MARTTLEEAFHLVMTRLREIPDLRARGAALSIAMRGLLNATKAHPPNAKEEKEAAQFFKERRHRNRDEALDAVRRWRPYVRWNMEIVARLRKGTKGTPGPRNNSGNRAK